MQLTAGVISTVLAALSTGAVAWTKDEGGKSIANDEFYSLRGKDGTEPTWYRNLTSNSE
jgi:hypothetical protein